MSKRIVLVFKCSLPSLVELHNSDERVIFDDRYCEIEVFIDDTLVKCVIEEEKRRRTSK